MAGAQAATWPKGENCTLRSVGASVLSETLATAPLRYIWYPKGMLGPGVGSGGWQGRGQLVKQAFLNFFCPFVPFLAHPHLCFFFTCICGALMMR